MNAAIVFEVGKTPVYGDFQEPIAAEGEARIAVTAAALSPLVKGRASGNHYSASAEVPFVVGVDGVGRLDDGRRVYFFLPSPPFGAMAEQAVVPISQCIVVPDALDDVTAAAIANPGMSSWAAFRERAKLLPGENVLINGATGTAGRLAVQIAKHLGAKTVIATGRNIESLNNLIALGADVTIPLTQPEHDLEAALNARFRGDGVDVVLDYLWGPSAELILSAAARSGKDGVPIRFVQIGAVSGANITLPGSVLRSSAIELMGSGIGSVRQDRLLNVISELMEAAVSGTFEIKTNVVPLSNVEETWTKDTDSSRTVFTVRQ
jgi:NADPH:quinone reductase-like Zn-dependent oxidoreductase